MRKMLFILMLMSIAILSATDVSGNQTGTWTLANSPYNVTADITVPAGQSLTIEPGVVVQINGLFQIDAPGYIIAQGTVTDSIKFTSTNRWVGIKLENTTNTSIFTYCKIEKAQTGLRPLNAPLTVNHCVINNASEYCINIYGIGGMATTLIKNTKISGAVKSGIYIAQNSNVIIDSCEVTGNGTGASYYGAIQMANQSDDGTCDAEIRNSWIHHNLKQGITAWDVTANNRINPNIHNNLIENNLTGVYLRQASGIVQNNTIQNNFIVGNANSGAGFMISGASAHPIIKHNTVTGNYCGFYIGESATANLGDPTGTSQNEGMNTITNNVDASSVPHSVVLYYNASAQPSNVVAKNNIWGTTDTALIDASITDQLDNPALGLVTYSPIYVPNNVSGTITYTGTAQYSTLILYFMDYVNEDNSCEYTLTSPGTYSVNVPEGHYFVQAIGGNIVNDELEPVVFGVYGSVFSPTPIHIQANQIYTDINITLNNYTENYTYRVLDTFTHDNKTIFPLGVISPSGLEEIRLLYKENDYIYNCGEMNFNPATSLWEAEYSDVAKPLIKSTNYAQGDHWGLAEGAPAINNGQLTITVPAGTFNAYRVTYSDSLFNNDINSKVYFADSIGFVSVRTFDTETHVLEYDNGLVSYDVSHGGTGLLPLATGNYWEFHDTETLPNKPSYLSVAKDTSNTTILAWDNACGEDWTENRIYRDNVLFATLPFDHCSYTPTADFAQYDWFVKAANSTSESEASNILTHTGSGDTAVSASRLAVKHYPNPVSYSAKSLINFNISLPEASEVELNIFNVKGQKVANITKSELTKGEHNIVWDGRNKNKNYLANGIYFYQLKTNKQSVTKKLLILK